MEETWTEYFSKYFPCTRITRNHRVSPEMNSSVGGGRVITKEDTVHGRRFNDELNGEINLHYVSDGDDDSHVVIECPSSPNSEGNGNVGDNFESRKKRSASIVDQKASYENNNSYLTTVFIETSKRKQLRVVHLRPIVQDIDTTDANEIMSYDIDNTTLPNDSCKTNNNNSSSSEDEDEYWFSKWSRRPRLKKFVDVQSKRSTNILGCAQTNILPVLTDNVPPSLSIQNEALHVPQHPCLNPNDDDDNVDGEDYVDGPKKQVTPSSPSSTESEAEQLNNSLENGFTNLAFQPDEDDNIETAVNNVKTNINDCQDTNTTTTTTNTIKMEQDFEIEKTQIEESSSININPSRDDTEDENLKPLLFFIHGISGSSETFSSQMDYFHNLGYEIVALDLVGHGLSSTPAQAKAYHFESLVQDVVTVFDHFVVDERQVVIIGHGYGACLATVLTRIRQKNARILISISGGGPTPMVASYWCQTNWLSFPCNFLPRRKKHGRFDNPDLKHILPYNVHENILKGQIWLDGDPAFHRRITIPTLLVYGMRDKVVNLVEVCEMERTIPRAFLEIINTAGHMVMWDESKKLNRMMRKFIESQWS